MLVSDTISLRRDECKSSILLFAKTYFPHYLQVPHCSFHEDLCKILENMTVKRGVRFALAAPRKSAKSTFVSCIYVLWSVCYKTEEYIILISDIQDQADKLLKHIKDELETNQPLLEDFPEVCLRQDEPHPKVWKANMIEAKNGVRVEAYGTFGKLRGQRHKQHRPSLIVMDDIENDENTRSPKRMSDLNDWLNNAVIMSGDDFPNTIFIGTIQTYGCLLAKYTKQDQIGWKKRIYRSIIHPAQNQNLWNKWKAIYSNKDCYGCDEGDVGALAFFKDHKKEMLEGTEVLWPEKEDYYSLMKLFMDVGETYFKREKQNEPCDPETQFFKWDNIRYWDDEFKNEEELRSAYKGSLTYHLACDPSLGKPDPKSSYSAIIVIAKHVETKRVFVLIADIEKKPPNKMIETIIALAEIYPFKTVLIESVQFQAYFADQVRDQAAERDIDLSVVKVSHTNTSKDGRIQSLEPGINNGRILFSRGQGMLLDQIKYYSDWLHKDGVDALEMAVSGSKEERKGTWGILEGDSSSDTDDDDDDDDDGPSYNVNSIL